MILRIDFEYARGLEPFKCHYQIDYDAPNITRKSELNAYLREFAAGWTGAGTLEIVSVSDRFKNETLDALSERIAGQVIEFNNGSVTFKRLKKYINALRSL